jgi:L-iditol 2-dehydrogenase
MCDSWARVASGLVELDSSGIGRFGLERADEALESDLDPNSLKSVVYPNEYQEGELLSSPRLWPSPGV